MGRSSPIAAAALAFAIAAVSCPAARADEAGPSPASRPESPFAVDPAIDVPVLAFSVAVWVTPMFVHDELPSARCAPCDPSSVNALDRTAIGRDDGAARVASDVGQIVIPALAGLGALLDAKPSGWSATIENLVIVAEAIAVSGAVNGILKSAVARPRPYMYDESLAEGRSRNRDAYRSFYSGHTALGFSAATSAAFLFSARRHGSRARWAVWTLGLAAASAVGVCRVLAGAHFWTDVIAGAAAGSAFGLLVPALHLRRGQRRPAEARAIAGPGGAAMIVSF